MQKTLYCIVSTKTSDRLSMRCCDAEDIRRSGGDTMNELYQKTERRGFVWQCANSSHKNRKYRGTSHDEDKTPCGHYNVYFGRKWMTYKQASRWTGKCKSCGRRKQLNLGNVIPETPDYYETKEKAQNIAKKKNEILRLERKRKSDEEDLFS